MDNPSFFLEGVVRDKDELQNFEGPLSLILLLLSKNKIEIRDISISDILDQYLEYLDKMQSMDLEIASEFVQMAAHLLYIKTRTLLAGDEEVSELEVLMASLEQLKCRDIFASIQKVLPELKKAFIRTLKLTDENIVDPENSHLFAAMGAALEAPEAVAILNKQDLAAVIEPSDLPFAYIVPISCKDGTGFDLLEQAFDMLFPDDTPCDGSLLTNARQAGAILRAKKSVDSAVQSLRAGMTPDAVLVDLESAMDALGEVTGRTMREDITNRIFERFCVGK